MIFELLDQFDYKSTNYFLKFAHFRMNNLRKYSSINISI